MKKSIWLFALLWIVAVGMAGCGSQGGGHEMGGKSISTENLNVAVFGKGAEAKFCPVMGEPIPAGKGLVHTMKDGRKITLCCGGCVAAIEKDPEKYTDFYF
jgi:hypothetical protein